MFREQVPMKSLEPAGGKHFGGQFTRKKNVKKINMTWVAPHIAQHGFKIDTFDFPKTLNLEERILVQVCPQIL